MASFTPSNAFLAALSTGAVDLTAPIWASLHSSSYSFDRRAHNTMAQVSGEVTPVTGYTAGGQALSTSVSINTTTHLATVSFAPVLWNASLTGVRGMMIYQRPTNTPADQLVLGYNDFGADQASVTGKFRVAGMGFTTTKTGSTSITFSDAAILKILNHQIDFDTDSIYVMVLGTGYTPSVAHSWRSDVTANEVSGTGYVAGGVQVPVTVSRDDATDSVLTELGGVILPNCTIAGRFAAYYKRLGGAASADPLIMVADWGATYSSNASVFPIGPQAFTRGAVIGS